MTKLTPKQMELIEALIANPMLPNTEVAKKVGINRNTVHNWKKLPQFQEELSRRLREIWADGERTAMEGMQSLAREGDFKACKYILDSLGYAPVQKQQIDANVSTDISVTIDGEDEDAAN